MCGRVNVSDHEGVRALLAMMGMGVEWPTRDPRYNVAPTQTLDVIRLDKDVLAVVPMSWGVSMSLKGKKGQPIIKRVPNARDDKLWSSYLWRNLIPHQRVLIPVNGFYEWSRQSGKRLRAHHIQPSNENAMFLAGIYRTATNEADRPEVTIVTTAANDAMANVHDRMPVIIGSHNEAMVWISDNDRQTLTQLLRPAGNKSLTITQVSDYVNKSSNEGPECTLPADTA